MSPASQTATRDSLFASTPVDVQDQGPTTAELKKEIATLAATVKQQAAQMQKVSARLELRNPALRTVANQ